MTRPPPRAEVPEFVVNFGGRVRGRNYPGLLTGKGEGGGEGRVLGVGRLQEGGVDRLHVSHVVSILVNTSESWKGWKLHVQRHL